MITMYYIVGLGGINCKDFVLLSL